MFIVIHYNCWNQYGTVKVQLIVDLAVLFICVQQISFQTDVLDHDKYIRFMMHYSFEFQQAYYIDNISFIEKPYNINIWCNTQKTRYSKSDT